MFPLIPGMGRNMPGEAFFNSFYPVLLALVVGLFFGLRHYFKGAQCTNVKKMKGKVVIITGANSGIGLELAKLLSAAGAKVIMGCRSLKKFEKAKEDIKITVPDANLKFIQIDLSSFKSIRKFAEQYLKSESKLDVLINNAGVLTNEGNEVTEDGFDWCLQVNYLGHFLLTHLLLDILKKTPNSRVINNTAHAFKLADESLSEFLTYAGIEIDQLTSKEKNPNDSADGDTFRNTNSNRLEKEKFKKETDAKIRLKSKSDLDLVDNTKTNQQQQEEERRRDIMINDDTLTHLTYIFKNFNQLKSKEYLSGGSYALSKLAMLSFTKYLASRIGNNQPTVNAANPGVVNSNLYRNMVFKRNILINITFGPLFWFFTKAPKDGAQTLMHCANSTFTGLGVGRGGDDDDGAVVTGRYFVECSEKDIAFNSKGFSGHIYECSLQLVGLGERVKE